VELDIVDDNEEANEEQVDALELWRSACELDRPTLALGGCVEARDEAVDVVLFRAVAGEVEGDRLDIAIK
jgi:hypothetical protein